MIRVFFIACLSIVFAGITQGQEYRTDKPGKEIEFAGYLFNTRQYEYAAEEYLKLVYLHPSDPLLKKRALESFRLSGDLEGGLYFSKVFMEPRKESTLVFYNEMVKLRMLAGVPVLSSEQPLDSSLFPEQYKESFLLNHMLAYEWEEVHNHANTIRSSPLFPFSHNTPENYYISPFLAASLSAVIPGTGKIYAKRWKEGLASLVFIGLTGYQSYRGFKKSGVESIYGWVSGSLCFGFDLGNIYGSQKAAKNYNQKLNENYRNEIINFYMDNY